MIINILIATIDAGIERIESILLNPHPDLKYIISHQVTDEQFRTVPEKLKRRDVLVTQIEGRGLCRNRNNALALAKGDIVMLADDDVCYRSEHIRNVIDAFKSNNDMDVACFKIATPAGDPEYKDYTGHTYLLNDQSGHYISTLEIVFRLDAVKSKDIVFDERFGLGSKLDSFGEEAVFIHDCIKAGLKVRYIPEYIVEHPAESSIKTLEKYATSNNVFKGAYDARRYGWLAFPAAFYDTMRFWLEISKHGKSPLNYLGERLQGAAYIYSNAEKG